MRSNPKTRRAESSKAHPAGRIMAFAIKKNGVPREQDIFFSTRTRLDWDIATTHDAPNNEISAILALPDIDVEMCRNTDTQQKKDDEDQLASSPVSVTNFLSLQSSAADHHPISTSYIDGTFKVQRSARRRGRIQRGCLGSSSDENLQFDISYRVFRPELLSCDDTVAAAPLIPLHGGPSLPSDYLYPLLEQVKDRSIIFYDQLGCGRSDAPKDLNMYSICKSVDDLEALLRHLRIRKFHLYGHSFGGKVAYEYVKRVAERPSYERCANENDIEPTCLSVILSNTSTSVEKSRQESDRILEELEDTQQDPSTVNSTFWKQNQCRLEETPAVLQNAIDRTGVEWYHTPQLLNYVAKTPSRWAQPLPPALIIRGTHDFVTRTCTDGWKHLFQHNKIREAEMDGSHYLHLEQPKEYGELLSSFLCEQGC